MRELGIGILGFGFMGKTHTYAYKTIPLYYSGLPFKTRLVGVCTSSLETAQAAKEAMEFEYATDNPEDLFKRPDIDIINVCTPNILHKEEVLKALKAGKHVYCDKPLAATYEEAAEIAAVAKECGVTAQVALQNRFFPATIRAKEIIEEGRIGKVLSFRACYLHSGSVDPEKPIGWKQDKRFGGGGVLLDLGSHVLDMMYYLLGGYASLMAQNTVVYSKRPDKNGNMIDIEAEDMSLIIANMKNGASGTIEASKIATGTNDELRFEIHGDRGAIRFNLMEPNWLDYYDNTIPEGSFGGLKGYTRIECVQRYKKPGGGFPGPKFSVGWTRAHVHSLYSFLECVYEGRQADPSFEDGAYIQYVMEKAYESNAKKCWIQLK
jgi:predicted dehydrogenase